MPAPLRSMTAVDSPTCATVPRRKLIKAGAPETCAGKNRLSEHIYEYPSKGRRQSARTARFRLGLGPGTLGRGQGLAARTGGGNGCAAARAPGVRDGEGQGVRCIRRTRRRIEPQNLGDQLGDGLLV